MNTKRIAYLIFLSLFTLIIAFSIYNYIFNFEETLEQFNILGYPEHLIHTLVIFQILGLIIILTNKGGKLIDAAYTGFSFNLVLAIIAHYQTSKGNGAIAVISLILLFIIYYLNNILKGERGKVYRR